MSDWNDFYTFKTTTSDNRESACRAGNFNSGGNRDCVGILFVKAVPYVRLEKITDKKMNISYPPVKDKHGKSNPN